MRKNRVVEQNRCYHLVSRLAHWAFFLDDEEKDRAVALMRRVEAGVKASMSYCINRTVSISSDPFDPYEITTDFTVRYYDIFKDPLSQEHQGQEAIEFGTPYSYEHIWSNQEIYQHGRMLLE